MNSKENQFIADLALELKPQRFWSPMTRALFWATCSLVFNIGAMLAYQAFRPGFAAELLNHPRFLVEILAATLSTFFVIYFVFSSLVPGHKIPKILRGLGALSFVVLAGTLVASFYGTSQAASPVGARALCLEELLVYGLLGMAFFFYFIRKSDFPTSRMGYFMAGFGAGLVPGTLMQLACMYSPTHSLLIHYFPAILLGGLGALILPLFKKVHP